MRRMCLISATDMRGAGGRRRAGARAAGSWCSWCSFGNRRHRCRRDRSMALVPWSSARVMPSASSAQSRQCCPLTPGMRQRIRSGARGQHHRRVGQRDYWMAAFAPASSSLALAALAASFATFSTTGLGDESTRLLGLLEAEAGQFTYRFDDVDLVGADLLEHDREFGLLLHRGGRTRVTSARHDHARHRHHRGGGAHAPLVLQRLAQLHEIRARSSRQAA